MRSMGPTGGLAQLRVSPSRVAALFIAVSRTRAEHGHTRPDQARRTEETMPQTFASGIRLWEPYLCLLCSSLALPCFVPHHTAAEQSFIPLLSSLRRLLGTKKKSYKYGDTLLDSSLRSVALSNPPLITPKGEAKPSQVRLPEGKE